MSAIFEYTDYRVYLRDALAERKSLDPTMTHRGICAALGLKTSNYILLVTQGKRNLNTELSPKLARLLKLDGNASEYFIWLVLFNQANSSLEKENYWKQLLSCKSKDQTASIDESQYEYYSHWYNPVIRELIVLKGRVWDTRTLSKALYPKVPAVQVRHSIELLERLGMIRKEGEYWEKASPYVATAPEVHSVAVFNYHRELIDLARNSLENRNGHDRNFTSVTLEMNEQEYQLVVSMLNEFRRATLGVCGSTGPSDRVYQMNLQLFPVSATMGSIPEDDE